MDGARTKGGEPSWKWRRILIYGTVAICFYLIYILINAPDTRVNDTIAWSLCLIITLLVMTYTGAATVQDIIAMWTMRTARPYAEQPLEPTPTEPKQPDQTVVVQPVVVAPQQKPQPDAPDGGA